jgi:hypothetical protein
VPAESPENGGNPLILILPVTSIVLD